MRKIISSILLGSFLFISCSEYQKLLKSTDYNKKYEEAVKYYKNEEFTRALTLFEGISAIFKGTDKEDEISYYQAYCNYNLGDYILAGYYFRNFAKTYPNHRHIEDVEFKAAYCYYMDSPRYSLDQENTLEAIRALQLFISKYPGSEKAQSCNELIDELREKLERKSFSNAKLYYDVGDYLSATITLKNTLKDYPDTKHREEALFLILKANYLYAINSIEAKQEERLKKTLKQFYPLEEEFPESKYMKEAKKILRETEVRIAKFEQKEDENDL